MKKIIALIMTVLLCVAIPSVGFAQNEPVIRILCLGKYLEPDVAPFFSDSRIMAPVRAVFEAVGAEVEWDEGLKTATGKKEDTEVLLTLGSNIITVNGEAIAMDTALTEKDGRVFAPVRFVAEAFGCKVSYHSESATAVISHTKTYEFYTSLSVALPAFEDVTGAELIRRGTDEAGCETFYYTYSEDYATDYFNALQADFGYQLSNVYFESGAHIYEYIAASGHIVKVADYCPSEGALCVTVTPDVRGEFGVLQGSSAPQPVAPDVQSPQEQTPDAESGANPLDYGNATGARLLGTYEANDGRTVYCYEYSMFAHMNYENLLQSQGWVLYDFDFEFFSNTSHYKKGDAVISVTVMYMNGEVRIVYP